LQQEELGTGVNPTFGWCFGHGCEYVEAKSAFY